MWPIQKILSESYLMNTIMTGFSNIYAPLCLVESRLSIERVSIHIRLHPLSKGFITVVLFLGQNESSIL